MLPDFDTLHDYPFELRPIDLVSASLLYRELLIDKCSLIGDLPKSSVIRMFERMLKQSLAEEFKDNYSAYTSNRLFEIDGVPYIATPDHFGAGYCFTHPFDSSYVVNSKLTGGHRLEGFTAPVVFRRDCPPTFKEFIKEIRNNFRPHFLGSKAECIEWKLVPQNEVEQLMVDTANCGLEHCICLMQRGKNWPEQTFTDLLISWVYPEISGHVSYLGAWDVLKSKYVCAMSFIRLLDGWTAINIAASRAEEYKPYSLIVAAHIALCKFAFYVDSVDSVDLGHNFEPYPYKDVIKNQYMALKSLPTLGQL